MGLNSLKLSVKLMKIKRNHQTIFYINKDNYNLVSLWNFQSNICQHVDKSQNLFDINFNFLLSIKHKNKKFQADKRVIIKKI
jgi:hypothetical protein